MTIYCFNDREQMEAAESYHEVMHPVAIAECPDGSHNYAIDVNENIVIVKNVLAGIVTEDNLETGEITMRSMYDDDNVNIVGAEVANILRHHFAMTALMRNVEESQRLFHTSSNYPGAE